MIVGVAVHGVDQPRLEMGIIKILVDRFEDHLIAMGQSFRTLSPYSDPFFLTRFVDCTTAVLVDVGLGRVVSMKVPQF